MAFHWGLELLAAALAYMFAHDGDSIPCLLAMPLPSFLACMPSFRKVSDSLEVAQLFLGASPCPHFFSVSVEVFLLGKTLEV